MMPTRMSLVRFSRGVLLTLAPLVVPALAAAQQVPGTRVLVMPFAAESDAKAPGGIGAARWLSEAAAVLISDGLAARGVGVLHRDDRIAVFDRLQLPVVFPLTRATTIRVGDLIGATEIVFGEMKLGQRLSVRARLVRLTTGQQLPDIADEAPLSEMFQLFERVSERVAASTGRPLASSPCDRSARSSSRGRPRRATHSRRRIDPSEGRRSLPAPRR